MEDKIRDLVARWQKACERKQNWEPHWQECYNYAFPQRENVSISRQLDNYGSKQNLHLYDGTAPDAVDQLASSLLSELPTSALLPFSRTSRRLGPDGSVSAPVPN